MPSVWPLTGSPSLHQNPPSRCGEAAPRSTQTVIYLDDLLLSHHQKDTLTEIFHYLRGLLSSLGFTVKLEKCSPALLDAVLDMTQMYIAPPVEQIVRIQGAGLEMLDCQSTSMGELSSLLGRMSHVAQTGLWVAPLHYRDLQSQQALLLDLMGWKSRHRISLSQQSLRDLTWWVSPQYNVKNPQVIKHLHSTSPSGRMHPCGGGVLSAATEQSGDAGVRYRQLDT